ncbi:MAG: ABC transporter ATP-binding protein [Abitibacteriaceae bacterium]|nr:ABC transporter ATP-binding protein [Abditibacteriaceae bacterium]MBV9864794.1 ABC transporter ATP-binding protein [Abditibacteriaceae bacterium]
MSATIEFRQVTYTVPGEAQNVQAVEPEPEQLPIEAPLPQDDSVNGQPVGSGGRGRDRRFTQRQAAKAPDSANTRRSILDRVSFTVPERSITCIMGVSGTGKTTLLRLMEGLLKPDSGQILIDGQDIVTMKERELNEVRRRMGFVFQYGALFDSLTIAQNVGFGLEQQRRPQAEIAEVVTQRLREVGLPDIKDKFPSEISGGMRKRVAMARALATQPKIVLYDEPTSGLDPVMARVIDDLIVNLRDRAGTTNVVVSHHLPSILRIADRILMLHNAQIVANGTPEEVQKSDSPIVQQFLEGRAVGPITVM